MIGKTRGITDGEMEEQPVYPKEVGSERKTARVHKQAANEGKSELSTISIEE